MTQVLAIDQGTTNSKAVLVDDGGDVRAVGSAPVAVTSPPSGLGGAGRRAAVGQRADRHRPLPDTGRPREPSTWAAVALSTQRESVVAWDRRTGRPLGPVIGWQDVRTAAWCRDRTGAARRRAGPQPDRVADRRHVLRAQDRLAAARVGGAVGSGGRLRRHGRLLADLAADRRRAACRPRPATRPALSSTTSWTSSGPPLCSSCSTSRPPCCPQVQRSDGDFGRCRSVPGLPDGTADHRGAGRLARRAVRPRVHHGRHGQGHLRHRHVGDDPDGRVRAGILPRPVHAGLAHRDSDVRPRGQHPVLRCDPGLGGPAARRRRVGRC